jgi:hypothetical protein
MNEWMNEWIKISWENDHLWDIYEMQRYIKTKLRVWIVSIIIASINILIDNENI